MEVITCLDRDVQHVLSKQPPAFRGTVVVVASERDALRIFRAFLYRLCKGSGSFKELEFSESAKLRWSEQYCVQLLMES